MTAMLSALCAVLVAVVFWQLTEATKVHKPHTHITRVICYEQTTSPVTIVCPGGESYWHPIGAATPIPPVPKS